jgi:aerobic-type carbon monoxide dehydrogenase small subunit (CoxS/CutS family)
MIMSGVDLLAHNPTATTDEIVEALQGNICRCGAYPRILAAVRVAGGALAARDG